ncbi:hypothetical protein [Streptomyces sp. NPDC008139]|uniref:hypothetical protein n=1 Tax=Streptomyces sp. NPDC008139 TaxID=3364814 RepID=UPI0036EDDB85
MVNIVQQSISQALDEPDDRAMFRQVKNIVAGHLRRMDPRATVTTTEFFNHTHVPDMVLEWPDRPRSPRRFIYLRTTSDLCRLRADGADGNLVWGLTCRAPDTESPEVGLGAGP